MGLLRVALILEWDPRDGSRKPSTLMLHIAQTAERGKFDLFFLADALNTGPTVHPSIMVRLEPLTLLAALASCTSRIGLAATASTTYSEPYNLARAFASIDHISGGRAAWNVVTGAIAEAAANFGRGELIHHIQSGTRSPLNLSM